MKFEHLASLRREGKRPHWMFGSYRSETITLSLIGDIVKEYGEIGHVVKVNKGPQHYPLEVFYDLDVIVAMHTKYDPVKLKWAKALESVNAASIYIWHIDLGYEGFERFLAHCAMPVGHEFMVWTPLPEIFHIIFQIEATNASYNSQQFKC